MKPNDTLNLAAWLLTTEFEKGVTETDAAGITSTLILTPPAADYKLRLDTSPDFAGVADYKPEELEVEVSRSSYYVEEEKERVEYTIRIIDREMQAGLVRWIDDGNSRPSFVRDFVKKHLVV